MQERLKEMQDLLERANALDHEFDTWKSIPLRVAKASLDYAELKADLAARLKASNKLSFSGPTPWYEAVYNAGIRNAHSAMVARSGTGPNLPKWHSAVQSLQSELSYYITRLEKVPATAQA